MSMHFVRCVGFLWILQRFFRRKTRKTVNNPFLFHKIRGKEEEPMLSVFDSIQAEHAAAIRENAE